MQNITTTELGDTITERPLIITVGGKEPRRFTLRPLSLGKTIAVERCLAAAAFNSAAYQQDSAAEALRCVVTQPDEACKALATAFAGTRREVFDSAWIGSQADWLKNNLTAEGAASLFSAIIDSGRDADRIMRQLGLDKEREDMRSAMRAKGTGSSLAFGGRSIYGTLIDAACERYGWTMDYTVWGISLTNLLMLLADKVSSFYLTKDERRKAHLRHSGERINGDDPTNFNKLRSMFSD